MPPAKSRAPDLMNLLWPAGQPTSMNVWAILDGARDDRIYPAVIGCYLENCCLYSGDLAPELQMTAPYLVKLDNEDRFTRYLLNQGWGNSWGVFFRSDTSMPQLRRHLRQFFRVKDERGRRLIFRYYDPRVLRVYLPTCLPDELRTFFGPIRSYMLETPEADALLEFRFDGKQLQHRRQGLPGTVASA